MDEETVVYLVDNDAGLVRHLGRLLETQGLAMRAFVSARDFLHAHQQGPPGCAVIDVGLPGLDGLAVQRALLAGGGGRLTILMSGADDVATAVQAMKSGAVDFLVKPFDDATFVGAVQAALARDREARQVRRELQSVRGRWASLTGREHEVLKQVLVGRLNKQIAADLGIAEKTIKVHRGRAMEKMEVDTLAELVRKTYAAEVGAVVECSYSRTATRACSTCPTNGLGRALCLMLTRPDHPR